MNQPFDYEVSIQASAGFEDGEVSEGELVLIKSFVADILKELVMQAVNDKE